MTVANPATPTGSPADAPAAGKRKESWSESLRVLLIYVLCFLGIRTFLFEPYNIPSASMVPTLQVGDYLFVNKFAYGYSRFSLPFSPDLFDGRIFFSAPHRGDVAVFRFTKDTSIDYIKRIVGLPGDTIQVREGELYLNGKLVPRKPIGDYTGIDENRNQLPGKLYDETLPSPRAGAPDHTVTHRILKLTDLGDANNTPVYTVPQGYFFAMGDDRDDSADSRFQGDAPEDLGYVPMQNLVGRATILFFSWDAAHPWYEFWYWPVEVRWSRLLHMVH
ncbi:signal peptidase I [Endobacter medicaginis]|uniref:Signal peptidase I n=1 Tax=Endobacter medicaginis TaxID=1181271 RepID=A0A850NQH0_9PROT|nr:signal peptidase I [Endobacter medicaginis]MCX5476352.1 signal peptidase I [Endobacter medicaginis]NVN30589.1 signal peptidase I [Endobacter medicaginis]